jgi:hypothetical protein
VIPALERQAAGIQTPDDQQDFELLGLQALPHTTDCTTHRVGSTEFPNCSCGLTVAIDHAGGRTRR